MKRYLLAVGGTGNKILESVVWAACADVLRTDGGPLDELRMLSVDVDASCGNTTRAMRACAAYEQVRGMLADIPYRHRGFNTALTLNQWDMDLSRRSASVRQMTEGHKRDQLLRRTLFDEKEAALCYSEGFRGHPDLGVMFFSDLLRNLERGESAGQDAFLGMLADIRAALEKGERVQVLLCGSIFGGTGASGIPMMARFLRERLAAYPELMEIGAVLMLPYYSVPEATGGPEEIAVVSDLFMDKAKTALQYYGMEGMIRKDGSDRAGILDAAYLLGVPESCFVEASVYATGSKEQQNDAHLLEWLATRCLARFFRKSCREGGMGCFYYQIGENRFGWEGFAEDAADYRRAYGGLMKLAAMFEAEYGPVLASGLTSGRRRNRAVNYYAAYFHRAHRMSAARREGMAADLAALTDCLRGYAGWILQVIATLPPPLRDVDSLEQAQRQAAENYRALLDAAGQLALMEDEIQRSGMAQEKTVRRGAPRETAVDQLLRAAKEKRQLAERLAMAQAELDKRTGGPSKLALMARMARGIDRAMAEEEKRAATRRAAIERAGQLPEGQRDETALRRDRETLYRLETHLRLLDAQRARVREDQRLAEMTGLRDMPPQTEAEDGLPGNDLFDRETLTDMDALLRTPREDRRAWRRLANEVEGKVQRMVLSPAPDRVNAAAMLNRLGDGAGSVKGASPLGCFLAQALEVAMEEVR